MNRQSSVGGIHQIKVLNSTEGFTSKIEESKTKRTRPSKSVSIDRVIDLNSPKLINSSGLKSYGSKGIVPFGSLNPTKLIDDPLESLAFSSHRKSLKCSSEFDEVNKVELDKDLVEAANGVGSGPRNFPPSFTDENFLFPYDDLKSSLLLRPFEMYPNERNFIGKTDNFSIKIASSSQIERVGTREKLETREGRSVRVRYGEVENSETVSYKDFKHPHPGGLYCSRTFGPVKNWVCTNPACSDTKRGVLPISRKGNDEFLGAPDGRGKYRELKCSVCGNGLYPSTLRRYRMGYIHLYQPLVHVSYIHSRQNLFAHLLRWKTKEIHALIYNNLNLINFGHTELFSACFAPLFGFCEDSLGEALEWLRGDYFSLSDQATVVLRLLQPNETRNAHRLSKAQRHPKESTKVGFEPRTAASKVGSYLGNTSASWDITEHEELDWGVEFMAPKVNMTAANGVSYGLQKGQTPWMKKWPPEPDPDSLATAWANSQNFPKKIESLGAPEFATLDTLLLEDQNFLTDIVTQWKKIFNIPKYRDLNHLEKFQVEIFEHDYHSVPGLQYFSARYSPLEEGRTIIKKPDPPKNSPFEEFQNQYDSSQPQQKKVGGTEPTLLAASPNLSEGLDFPQLEILYENTFGTLESFLKNPELMYSEKFTKNAFFLIQDFFTKFQSQFLHRKTSPKKNEELLKGHSSSVEPVKRVRTGTPNEVGFILQWNPMRLSSSNRLLDFVCFRKDAQKKYFLAESSFSILPLKQPVNLELNRQVSMGSMTANEAGYFTPRATPQLITGNRKLQAAWSVLEIARKMLEEVLPISTRNFQSRQPPELAKTKRGSKSTGADFDGIDQNTSTSLLMSSIGPASVVGTRHRMSTRKGQWYGRGWGEPIPRAIADYFVEKIAENSWRRNRFGVRGWKDYYGTIFVPTFESKYRYTFGYHWGRKALIIPPNPLKKSKQDPMWQPTELARSTSLTSSLEYSAAEWQSYKDFELFQVSPELNQEQYRVFEALSEFKDQSDQARSYSPLKQKEYFMSWAKQKRSTKKSLSRSRVFIQFPPRDTFAGAHHYAMQKDKYARATATMAEEDSFNEIAEQGYVGSFADGEFFPKDIYQTRFPSILPSFAWRSTGEPTKLAAVTRETGSKVGKVMLKKLGSDKGKLQKTKWVAFVGGKSYLPDQVPSKFRVLMKTQVQSDSLNTLIPTVPWRVQKVLCCLRIFDLFGWSSQKWLPLYPFKRKGRLEINSYVFVRQDLQSVLGNKIKNRSDFKSLRSRRGPTPFAAAELTSSTKVVLRSNSDDLGLAATPFQLITKISETPQALAKPYLLVSGIAQKLTRPKNQASKAINFFDSLGVSLPSAHPGFAQNLVSSLDLSTPSKVKSLLEKELKKPYKVGKSTKLKLSNDFLPPGNPFNSMKRFERSRIFDRNDVVQECKDLLGPGNWFSEKNIPNQFLSQENEFHNLLAFLEASPFGLKEQNLLMKRFHSLFFNPFFRLFISRFRKSTGQRVVGRSRKPNPVQSKALLEPTLLARTGLKQASRNRANFVGCRSGSEQSWLTKGPSEIPKLTRPKVQLAAARKTNSSWNFSPRGTIREGDLLYAWLPSEHMMQRLIKLLGNTSLGTNGPEMLLGQQPLEILRLKKAKTQVYSGTFKKLLEGKELSPLDKKGKPKNRKSALGEKEGTRFALSSFHRQLQNLLFQKQSNAGLKQYHCEEGATILTQPESTPANAEFPLIESNPFHGFKTDRTAEEGPIEVVNSAAANGVGTGRVDHSGLHQQNSFINEPEYDLNHLFDLKSPDDFGPWKRWPEFAKFFLYNGGPTLKKYFRSENWPKTALMLRKRIRRADPSVIFTKKISKLFETPKYMGISPEKWKTFLFGKTNRTKSGLVKDKLNSYFREQRALLLAEEKRLAKEIRSSERERQNEHYDWSLFDSKEPERFREYEKKRDKAFKEYKNSYRKQQKAIEKITAQERKAEERIKAQKQKDKEKQEKAFERAELKAKKENKNQQPTKLAPQVNGIATFLGGSAHVDELSSNRVESQGEKFLDDDELFEDFVKFHYKPYVKMMKINSISDEDYDNLLQQKDLEIENAKKIEASKAKRRIMRANLVYIDSVNIEKVFAQFPFSPEDVGWSTDVTKKFSNTLSNPLWRNFLIHEMFRRNSMRDQQTLLKKDLVWEDFVTYHSSPLDVSSLRQNPTTSPTPRGCLSRMNALVDFDHAIKRYDLTTRKADKKKADQYYQRFDEYLKALQLPTTFGRENVENNPNFPVKKRTRKIADKKRLVKQYRAVLTLLKNPSCIERGVFDKFPILPPDLRPILQLGDVKAVSDMTALYILLIQRNLRHGKILFESYGESNEFLIDSKTMVQVAADNALDKCREKNVNNLIVGRMWDYKDSQNQMEQWASAKPKTKGPGSIGGPAAPRTLYDRLSGKEGRFRMNLLGKRVDYSGRSVIIVGPTLNVDQCGLPYEMAFELFQPFVLRYMLEDPEKKVQKYLQYDPWIPDDTVLDHLKWDDSAQQTRTSVRPLGALSLQAASELGSTEVGLNSLAGQLTGASPGNEVATGTSYTPESSAPINIDPRIFGSGSIKSLSQAKLILRKKKALGRMILRQIVPRFPVLLNRAPTLHRLGIQGFHPVLVYGRALHLHPLVCGSFNADFDGDQMAVHIPLSLKARFDIRMLMFAPVNWLSPATGQPTVVPSQDMVLGLFYMTLEKIALQKGRGAFFQTLSDAVQAYQTGMLEIQSQIWVKWNGPFANNQMNDESSEEVYDEPKNLDSQFRRKPFFPENQIRFWKSEPASNWAEEQSPEPNKALGAPLTSSTQILSKNDLALLRRKFHAATFGTAGEMTVLARWWHDLSDSRVFSSALNRSKSTPRLDGIGANTEPTSLAASYKVGPTTAANEVGSAVGSSAPRPSRPKIQWVKGSGISYRSVKESWYETVRRQKRRRHSIPVKYARKGGFFYHSFGRFSNDEDEPLEIRVHQTGNSRKIYADFQWSEDSKEENRMCYIRTTPGRALMNQLIYPAYEERYDHSSRTAANGVGWD